MKQIFKTTLLLLSFVLLCGCEETLIPVPPKDASEYISPLEDGNKWVIKLTTKHVITEIVGNDTTTSQRDVYMTQVIQGDSLFNGKICKKLYYYFHYKPTVGKGDTVYMGEKFPRIFPDAHYICSDKENLYYGNADEHPDDVFIQLARQFYVSHYTSPVLLYEKDFVIWQLFRGIPDADNIYETHIISLNLAAGDEFWFFETTNTSSIILCDGKERRVMRVRAEKNFAPNPKYYTTYWIEGIGCIVNGITPIQTETLFRPTSMEKLISFSTNGQEIYCGIEGDFTTSGILLNRIANIYTTVQR